MDDDPVLEAIDRLGTAVADRLAEESAWLVSDFPETWRRQADDPKKWVLTPQETRSLHPRLLFELEQSNDEWAAARKALRDDPVIGRVVDQLVGDSDSASRVQTISLLGAALRAWVRPFQRQRRVAKLIAGWRAYYGSEFVETTSLRVLSGVTVRRRLSLSPSLHVRMMTDDEVSASLAAGVLAPMPRFGGFVFMDTPACIVHVGQARLIIGEDRSRNRTLDTRTDPELAEEAVVASLRLLGFTRIRAGPRIRIGGGGFTSWSNFPFAEHLGAGSGEPLTSATRRSLRQMAELVLQSLRKEKAVAIAIRRFSQSFEPRHEQDRFLDLWIAMEALFGTESSTEVSFRLCINAARTLSVRGMSRHALFRWIQKSYAVRSKIVHGARPSMRQHTRLSGAAARSVGELSDDLTILVRQAVRRRLAVQSDPDWARILLAET